MKPLNYDNSPCSPISSNCVIWQGPDLHCIKLCTGDTVSDVVANLATELCTIMEQLDITNYDLSCFNLVSCPPNTFEALIQFLIEKICSLEGISSDPNSNTKSSTSCPDCLVSVASCFIVNNITSMQLIDYVNMIGQRVCNILTTITELQNQINELDVRVTVLENKTTPTFTLPTILVDCTLQSASPGPFIGSGGPATAIDLILSALINDDTYGYCALRTATGLPAALQNAVASQCILNTDLQLSTGITWSTNLDWVQTPTTVADAINNIWLVVCDMYDFLSNLDNTITVEDTNTVNLTLTSSNILSAAVQDTGWVKLVGFDTYMNDTAGTLYEYPQVRRIGNQLHFKGVIVIPLAETTSALRPWLYTSTVNNYEEDPSTGNATTIETPYQGTGGVITGTFGSITFNRNAVGSAESVIPVSVIPSGYQLDGAYAHPSGFKIAQRIIKIASNTSTMLTTLLTINISATGILSLGLVKNSEESNINGDNNAFDTSHLNYIISHVISGESVPQFKTPSNIIHSKAGGGTSDLNLDFPATGTYPFSCNANDETEIGGFFMTITGLTAFISPCGTLIPTPTPCAIP
jgi:hypothetical protein